MGSSHRKKKDNKNIFNKIYLWFILIFILGFIKVNRGIGLIDLYGLVSRISFPGLIHKEWIKEATLIESQTRLRLLEKDNERLRSMLSLQKSSKSNVISAAVIQRSVDGWWHQLQLNKGSIHGVRSGDAVTGPGGLIGIIQSVSPTTSLVQLLTAPGSKIGVWISRNSVHGIMLGVGTNRPKLRFLEKNLKINVGDIVSTSPASTLLPPNLPVGLIQEIDQDTRLAPNAIIQLFASPEAIDWVQIKKI